MKKISKISAEQNERETALFLETAGEKAIPFFIEFFVLHGCMSDQNPDNVAKDAAQLEQATAEFADNHGAEAAVVWQFLMVNPDGLLTNRHIEIIAEVLSAMYEGWAFDDYPEDYVQAICEVHAECARRGIVPAAP